MNHLTQLLYSVLYNQPDMQNAFLVLTLTGLASIKSFDQICFLGFYIININFRCLRARVGKFGRKSRIWNDLIRDKTVTCFCSVFRVLFDNF